MKSADADRNLLFGVIALQTDAVTRTQFIDGCALWASQKERPLADLLEERGWITAEDRADVERLVDRKLRRHGGDVRRQPGRGQPAMLSGNRSFTLTTPRFADRSPGWSRPRGMS